MEQTTLIAIAAAAALILFAIAVFVMQRNRTNALREQFGAEYDRTLENAEGRRHAEADLLERQKRVSKLDIRPLTQQEHDRYLDRWQTAKADFVDSPQAALSKADDLITDVMKTRGYPVSDFENQHKDLTVAHADVAKRYMDGHELRTRARADDADTEEMRAGMKHYEAIFDRLLGDVETQTRETETV